MIVDLSEDDSPPGQQEDQSNNENVVDFLSWDEEPQYDGRVFEVFFDREPIDEQEGYHHTGAYPGTVLCLFSATRILEEKLAFQKL